MVQPVKSATTGLLDTAYLIKVPYTGFAQAVDEMKGHQYANIQHRINGTGNLLDKEFKYLHNEWRNPSKQNNKIKVFGMKDEYKTGTAGIIDYTSDAYGVAYVHEDETFELGNSSGWYAGAIYNRFKLDLQQLMKMS